MQLVEPYFPNEELNLGPPEVKVMSPNDWTTREFPRSLF